VAPGLSEKNQAGPVRIPIPPPARDWLLRSGKSRVSLRATTIRGAKR
jgi:hypothetical protein